MTAPFLNMEGVAFAIAGGLSGLGGSRRTPRLVAEDDALTVRELSLEQLDAAQAAWCDLSARALEPNAFYEPGFALSAARHFPLNSRPRFIVVSDGARITGLFPIVPSHPLVGDGFIRLWLTKQATLATPLVDRDRATDTIAAFLDWVEARSLAAGVVFARTPAKGAFHAALAEVARRDARRVETLESFERAALLPGGEADETCARASGSKRQLANIQRMRRRLAEKGAVEFQIVDSPEEVRLATEEFLTLEAAGWKAGRGAFLSEPALATFLRAATRQLARDRRCKISALRLDGRPVAMAILIDSQNRSYYWKIAYDESLRSCAPGLQLIYEQTKAQLARPGVEITDSCAMPDHPVIGRMWPDRVRVCDVAVQLQTNGEAQFQWSCRRDGARRHIRELAKRTANRLLKRKVS
ncbi:MAG: GNAT family N-acetyltransferase [Methylocystis sp.]|nr:MAG: GNAT family N-acetyltransferase [Methylocystis sp.]